MAAFNENWLLKGLEKRENLIKIGDIQEDVCESILELGNYSQIGSYNWCEKDRGKIIIPGVPRIYNNSTKLYQLDKNSHKQMVDENRYHQPEYPLESILKAVNICRPEFSFENVDFVTDRNNLRKLFNFVESSADKSFRIEFQKIGNTIFLIRNEEKTEEVCNDYGKSFENKVTTSNSDSSIEGSHRRIVSYEFGSFKLVVRFEVDCVEKLNDICSAISSLSLNTNNNYLKSNALNKFDNDDAIMELTTKSTYNNYEFPSHKWNQLFFSKTNFLVIGWHNRGKLVKIEKLNFEEVTKKSGINKTKTQSNLKKLHNLLGKIKAIASSAANSSSTAEDSTLIEPKTRVYSIIFNHNNKDELELHACNSKVHEAIPPERMKEFINL
jgi:hypothetical protein